MLSLWTLCNIFKYLGRIGEPIRPINTTFNLLTFFPLPWYYLWHLTNAYEGNKALIFSTWGSSAVNSLYSLRIRSGHGVLEVADGYQACKCKLLQAVNKSFRQLLQVSTILYTSELLFSCRRTVSQQFVVELDCPTYMHAW